MNTNLIEPPIASNPQLSTKPYYPSLDGLRGLAILMVIFLHNFNFVKYFLFGWLGVDLFFVLSGFLITDILLRSVDRPNFLKNFYIRRVLRIFPIYYFTVFICLYILPLLFNFELGLLYYKNNVLWLVIFLQNWLFIFKPPEGHLLLHLWSLAVEEQFYILWPIVILFVKDLRKLLWILITVLISLTGIRYFLWSSQTQQVLHDSLFSLTRIDGICVGSLLAIIMRLKPTFLKTYKSIIVLTLAGLNILMYLLNNNPSQRLPYFAFIGYTTFAIMFGFLVYEAIIDQSKIIRVFFCNPILQFLGKISYGLYVFHWPIYLLLLPVVQSFLITSVNLSVNVAVVSASIFVTALSIMISFVSYHYFEMKFLNLKKYFT